MGLNGPARVVGIDPYPTIEPDNGSGRTVVTGTMAHPGANIYLGRKRGQVSINET